MGAARQNELCQKPGPIYDAPNPPDVNQPPPPIAVGKFAA